MIKCQKKKKEELEFLINSNPTLRKDLVERVNFIKENTEGGEVDCISVRLKGQICLLGIDPERNTTVC